MSDLISRADAIKSVTRLCVDGYKAKVDGHFISLTDALINTLSELPSAEPKGANLINRHDATTVIREECLKCSNITNADLLGRILSLPTSQQTDCTEFIEWLVEVVLDDEDWELNAVGYGEIIARKLKKLGLLEVKDGYYIRSSAEAKDTQTEEQARYVAKETELAHIEARLECAEKRLQEMPRCLNGIKAKQITKISADRPSNVLQKKNPTPIEDYMIGKSRSADIPKYERSTKMTNGELLIQTIESVMGIEFDRSFDWKYMKKGDVLIAFDGSWWRKEEEDGKDN